MKERVVAGLLGLLSLSTSGCSKHEPLPLRTDRAPPTYVSPQDRAGPWLTVDIDTDNAVRYRDKVVFDPAVDDPQVLVRALSTLREQALQQGVISLQVPPEPPAPISLDDPLPLSLPTAAGDAPPHVREPVLVKAHRWSLWAATDLLMRTASRPEIAFYAVQLALLDVPD